MDEMTTKIEEEELLSSIRDAHKAMDKYLNNEFLSSILVFKEKKEDSVFHSLGHNAYNFVEAMMIYDDESLKQSTEICDSSLRLLSSSRQRFSWTETIFGSSTEITCNDQFTSFVKGTLTIRTSYRIYRNCESFLHDEENWKERHLDHRNHFAAGVKLGLGAFNLVLSTLPSKVLRLLEFVGFTGEKATGLSDLLESSRGNSIFSPFAALLLLSWNSLGSFTFGIGNVDMKLCEELLSIVSSSYPQGFLNFYFQGRHFLINGQMEKASGMFERCMDSQNYRKEFKMAAIWDLMFLSAYELDFSKAVEYSFLLQKDSNWSPCLYFYLSFVFSLAVGEIANGGRLEHLARKVSEQKQRIAGRSVPFEKFCTRKAERFLRGHRMPLLHWEFIYFWNGFEILARNQEMLKQVHRNILQQGAHLKEDEDRNDALVFALLNAVCLKHLGEFEEAEKELEKIFNHSHGICSSYNYLLPTATYELGRIKENTDEQEARRILKKAQKMKRYLLENKVQMRIRCALQQLEDNENREH